MQNHFIKIKLNHHQRLATPLDSLVYLVMPDDHLVTREDILSRVYNYSTVHSDEGRFATKEVNAVIASMVERGFIREICGKVLENFIASPDFFAPPGVL